MITNQFKNTFIEFHILQTFPVTCLNRDDMNSPKTAMIGNTIRARVSSQCWKRQVRLIMQELGVNLGYRTKHIGQLIIDACIKKGASEEQATLCGVEMAKIFDASKEAEEPTEQDEADGAEGKDEKEIINKNSTLFFLSPGEVDCIAKKLKEKNFIIEDVLTELKDSSKNKKTDRKSKAVDKPITLEVLKKKWFSSLDHAVDAVDIALFGRMLAKVPTMTVEAATSFAHAISTHVVNTELDFFTAIDDFDTEGKGAAHLGTIEFNAATYYRYISLDLGQLWHNLNCNDYLYFSDSIKKFIMALFMAVPKARQATQSGACPWNFAKILIRKGQRVQVSFETDVTNVKSLKKQYDIDANDSVLQLSTSVLKQFLTKQEKLFTEKLFNKLAEYTYGEDQNVSIVDITNQITEQLKNS